MRMNYLFKLQHYMAGARRSKQEQGAQDGMDQSSPPAPLDDHFGQDMRGIAKRHVLRLDCTGIKKKHCAQCRGLLVSHPAQKIKPEKHQTAKDKPKCDKCQWVKQRMQEDALRLLSMK